jgi:hypothetical protein
MARIRVKVAHMIGKKNIILSWLDDSLQLCAGLWKLDMWFYGQYPPIKRFMM